MNKNGYFQSDKDGKVTKAPPKKQPPPFSGGSSVLDSNGKLLNSVLPEGYPYSHNTHEVLTEFTVTTVESPGFNGIIQTNYADAGDTSIDDIVESVIINYDNVDYKCNRFLGNAGGIVRGYGNPALYFPDFLDFVNDTGEPFVWFFFGGWCQVATTTPGEHTFIVKNSNPTETIIPMRFDFLPESCPYHFTEVIDLVPEATYQFVQSDERYENYYGVDYVFEIGKTYTVYWDGDEYTCFCSEVNAEDRVLGNPAIYPYNEMGEANDTIPFAIWCDSTGSFAGIVTTEEGSHTIRIRGEIEHIAKLDEKCLPLLTSPNGTQYKITVADDGTLSATAVT